MASSDFLYETNDNYRYATDAKIKANRVKGMLSRFEDKDVLHFLSSFHDGFYASLYQTICKYGKLSEKQMHLAKKAMSDRKEFMKKESDRKSDFKKQISGLVQYECQVIKGGKAGAQYKINGFFDNESQSIKYHKKNDETFSLSATNLRKGDVFRAFVDEEAETIVLSDSPTVTRWNGRTRQAYIVSMRF